MYREYGTAAAKRATREAALSGHSFGVYAGAQLDSANAYY